MDEGAGGPEAEGLGAAVLATQATHAVPESQHKSAHLSRVLGRVGVSISQHGVGE